MIYIGISAISVGETPRRGRKGDIAPWNYTNKDSLKVTCFTNADEAELFSNGVSLGKKSMRQVKEKMLVWEMNISPVNCWPKGIWKRSKPSFNKNSH